MMGVMNKSNRKPRSLSTTHILDLPDEVLRIILKKVGSYRRIRIVSGVCTRFKTVCDVIIKCGFLAIEKCFTHEFVLPETLFIVMIETYIANLEDGTFDEQERLLDEEQPPEDPENPAPPAPNLAAIPQAQRRREMTRPFLEHYIAYSSRLLHTFKQFAVGLRFFKAVVWSTSIHNNDFTTNSELSSVLDFFCRSYAKYFSLSLRCLEVVEGAKLVQNSVITDMRMRVQTYIDRFDARETTQQVSQHVFGSTMVALLDTALDGQCEELLIYDKEEENPTMRMKFKINHAWLNLQNLVARTDINAARNRKYVLRFMMKIISKTNYKYLDKQHQERLMYLNGLLNVDDVTQLDLWELKLPEPYIYKKQPFDDDDWMSYEDLLAQSILRGHSPLYYKYDCVDLSPYQTEHSGVEFEIDIKYPLEFLSKAMWRKREYPDEKPTEVEADFEMAISSYDSHSERVLHYGMNRFLHRKCRYRVTQFGIDVEKVVSKKGRQLEEQEKRKVFG